MVNNITKITFGAALGAVATVGAMRESIDYFDPFGQKAAGQMDALNSLDPANLADEAVSKLAASNANVVERNITLLKQELVRRGFILTDRGDADGWLDLSTRDNKPVMVSPPNSSGKDPIPLAVNPRLAAASPKAQCFSIAGTNYKVTFVTANAPQALLDAVKITQIGAKTEMEWQRGAEAVVKQMNSDREHYRQERGLPAARTEINAPTPRN